MYMYKSEKSVGDTDSSEELSEQVSIGSRACIGQVLSVGPVHNGQRPIDDYSRGSS